ncbi:hypothetical protein PIB30_085411, partial [Stylosanthes scabra]|nr:hypothetical protein [Stylosanthes scabra]
MVMTMELIVMMSTPRIGSLPGYTLVHKGPCHLQVWGLKNSIGSPLSPGQTCCYQVSKHLCHAAVANLVLSRNCHYA